MNTPPAGLLLPETLLTSPEFLVLATMVAFNTIVYLGLTISKFIPWPHQFHPRQIRAALARLGITMKRSRKNRSVDAAKLPLVDEPMTDTLARNEIPLAFGMLGGVNILIAVGGGISTGFAYPAQDVVAVAVGACLILVAVITSHRPVDPHMLMWGWVIMCTAVVAKLTYYSHYMDMELPLSFALLIMIIAVPVTLGRSPAIVGGLSMFTMIMAAELLWVVEGRDNLTMGVLAALCLIAALVLLHLRLAMVDRLAEHKRRLEAFAVGDPVTGVLSKPGFLSLAQGLADSAARLGAPLYVVVVKVWALADLTRAYGHAYGDTVMRTVAEVLRQSSRPGDLVSRWSGQRFVVLGIAQPPLPETFAIEVGERLRATGVDVGRMPVTVWIGTCTDDPRHVTFDEMLDAAEADLVATARRVSADGSAPARRRDSVPPAAAGASPA